MFAPVCKRSLDQSKALHFIFYFGVKVVKVTKKKKKSLVAESFEKVGKIRT
jgi:hypothetical protein